MNTQLTILLIFAMIRDTQSYPCHTQSELTPCPFARIFALLTDQQKYDPGYKI